METKTISNIWKRLGRGIYVTKDLMFMIQSDWTGEWELYESSGLVDSYGDKVYQNTFKTAKTLRDMKTYVVRQFYSD